MHIYLYWKTKINNAMKSKAFRPKIISSIDTNSCLININFFYKLSDVLHAYINVYWHDFVYAQFFNKIGKSKPNLCTCC